MRTTTYLKPIIEVFGKTITGLGPTRVAQFVSVGITAVGIYNLEPYLKICHLKDNTRYRTLTIYNVFFEQNKMAEGGIRNTNTGYSVGVSCFYSHKGPSWIHV